MSGQLNVFRRAQSIEISLPANPCRSIAEPPWLRAGLGVTLHRVFAGHRKYMVEVAGETVVRSLRPTFDVLRGVADGGVIDTARADDSRYDIVSRYFAGYVGVDEDHATGSAHACLVPYWSERLGKTTLRARQLSPRGGELVCRMEENCVRLTAKLSLC